MSNIFDFLKLINGLSEKTKSLSVLSSPLQIQMNELAKSSNINIQPDALSALMPISKLLANSSFQNSLISANKINESLNASMMTFSKALQNHDFQKISQSIKIPDSTLSAISNLVKQQEYLNGNLFKSLGVINSTSIAKTELSKIKNLNTAFSSLSSEIAKIASLNHDWNIIENFEDLTNEAIILSDQLTTDSTSLSPENFSIEFKSFLKLVEEFYLKYKDAGVLVLFIIDVILRFASLHQYYDFIKDKPEPATKLEVIELQKANTTILKSIEEVKGEISKNDKISFTSKKCKIKLKPNIKSLVINELPKDFEIIIVKKQPNWTLINFSDPKDGLPQTGWINIEDIK
ncbi:hypothetical protein SAMN05421846_105107 [Chryseobacterium taeanense]|uniref:SH3 domain-containing protein n=1 Tax=Chryseobacterium taeanense TaxID=311334 RepID=A0A1G8IUG5_9FLAO|nr:hypothetical protein [Chryseobacterium taeanense]SDI22658.1 hypothetical protein SAMN05421846_105107 [Chryseobacterium taeanense]